MEVKCSRAILAQNPQVSALKRSNLIEMGNITQSFVRIEMKICSRTPVLLTSTAQPQKIMRFKSNSWT